MKILVTDFDGTLTRYDFYDLVRQKWPLQQGDDPWEDYVHGEISHFEALKRIFSRIRGPEAALLDIANAMGLTTGLSDALAQLQSQGWSVLVASAGCDWYINKLLHTAKVSLEVHSNSGKYDPDNGLLLTAPVTSRFFNTETGVDKLAIVRDALSRAETVAFAGDGRPDLAPSLLVASEFRFARGWLAQELTRRGEYFHPFESWSEIPDILTK